MSGLLDYFGEADAFNDPPVLTDAALGVVSPPFPTGRRTIFRRRPFLAAALVLAWCSTWAEPAQALPTFRPPWPACPSRSL